MLQSIGDPKQKHEQHVEWIGGSFDPEEFDLNEVNRMLGDIR